MDDFRAFQIAKWLAKPKDVQSDEVKAVAYVLCELEKRGELEMFVSDAVDRFGHGASKR